jgi:hypothetical protein
VPRRKPPAPCPIEIEDLDRFVERLPQDSSEEGDVEYLRLRDVCAGLEDWRLLARVVRIQPSSKPHQVKKGIYKGNQVTALSFHIIDERGDEGTCLAYGDIADRLLALLREGLVY